MRRRAHTETQPPFGAVFLGLPENYTAEISRTGVRTFSDSRFDLAAVLCGHDPATSGGAEAARHDFRVWDLVEQGAHR